MSHLIYFTIIKMKYKNSIIEHIFLLIIVSHMITLFRLLTLAIINEVCCPMYMVFFQHIVAIGHFVSEEKYFSNEVITKNHLFLYVFFFIFFLRQVITWNCTWKIRPSKALKGITWTLFNTQKERKEKKSFNCVTKFFDINLLLFRVFFCQMSGTCRLFDVYFSDGLLRLYTKYKMKQKRRVL